MTNKYAVIYADPPWRFKTYSEAGEGRSAISHYDCMSLKDIKALPISNMAMDDCCLFLWVTDPFLKNAFDVMESWGFEYKTVAFYWAKLNKYADLDFTLNDFFTGMGYWTRANPEQCLLATRGKPKRINNGVRKLIISPRREHSRKPDEIYDRIEQLVKGPYLELFSRQTRLGWDSLGDQAGLFDHGHVETRRRSST